MKALSIRQPDADRFWGRVDKTGGLAACWPWQGHLDAKGYGTFWLSGAGTVKAHRVAHQLAGGEPGTETMHSCDLRRCCNPAHLSAGTHAENMLDMVSKGRQAKGDVLAADKRGTKNPQAKLTAEKAREIRRRFGTMTNAALAAEFGVTAARVSEIGHGKAWVHA